MTGTSNKPFSIWATLVLVSFGVAFTAAGAVEASNHPAQCEIVTKTSDGMIAIEALAHAKKATSGSYNLTISGPGTNLDQGGAFDAKASQSITLGSAMLSANGSGLDIELEVHANGTTSKCTKRVGSI
jgi:hypothetical protein